MSSLWRELADVLYGGINPDIPGHGGEECANYLPRRTMIFETLLSTSMMIVVGIFGWKTFTMPKAFPRTDDFAGKRFLLTMLCLVFGVEVGYKICSRQVLYLLNPCHIITVIEVRPVLTSFLGCTLSPLMWPGNEATAPVLYTGQTQLSLVSV